MSDAERVLYLSPHLDDVVWSCPGDVLRTVAAGGHAEVVTVFTSSDGGAGERTRKHEDQRAVQMLGAHARHLDLVDAPWRTPWWDTDDCAFADLMCGPLDPELVGDVVDALVDLTDGLRPDRIVAPLGVGLHIDHRTVHAAAVEVSAATGLSVEFYEDRPYSFIEQSVAVRLGHLGVADTPIDWTGHWASFDAALYVRTFVSGSDERQRILDHVQSIAPSPAPRTCTPIDVALTSDELATARLAMTAYGSQTHAFIDEPLLGKCANERRWRFTSHPGASKATTSVAFGS